MRQGSGLDEKDGYDFLDGDWSVATEPRGPWCSQHGYYDCPECAGTQASEPTHVVAAAVPIPPPTRLATPVERAVLERKWESFPSERPLSEDPSLWERVKRILSPRDEEAEARGRAVYERAMRISKERQCSYDEALSLALKER